MRSIRYLLIVTALTIIGLVFVVFTLRNHGISNTLLPTHHPLLNRPFWLIAHRGGAMERPEDTFVAFDHALKVDPQIMLEVDVRQCLDRLVVISSADVSKTTDGHGLISQLSFAQLEKLDAGYRFGPNQNYPWRGKNLRIPSLQQVLARYPRAHFLINVQSNRKNIQNRIIRLVSKYHAGLRSLIQSPYDVIMSSIKKERPQWLFGTGIRDLTRTEMLSQLFLAPMAPIYGDVYVSPIVATKGVVKGTPILTDRIIAEVHRRGKKVYGGVINNAAQFRYWRKKGLDGIMTDRPSLMAPLSSLAPSQQTH